MNHQKQYNGSITRFFGTKFLTAVGGETSGTLIDRHGNPISSSLLKKVSAIHRTNWQGRQLLYASSRTNLAFLTTTMAGTGWTTTVSGTGTAPVTTSAYATGPDGNTSAIRIQCNLGATPASAESVINWTNTTGLTTGSTYCTSFWITSNGAGSVGQNVVFRHVARASYTTVTLTNTWQRVFNANAALNTSPYFEIGLRGGLGITVPTTADFLLFGVQQEVGSTPTGTILNATTSPISITDYTMSGSTASFGQAATAGAIYDWDGIAIR